MTINFLKSGGIGAGSYYFWIYLQFVILLPIFSRIFSRYSIKKSLLIFIVLSQFLEILSCLLLIPEWVYRLTFFRYTFIIFLGYYITNVEIRLSFSFILLTLLSVISILLFQYGDFNSYPFIYESNWKIQHWMTYFYVIFLIFILLKIYEKFKSYSVMRYFLLIGKYSYHIFLFQMVYFCLPINKFLYRLFPYDWATIIYIILSLVICVVPIIFYKSKFNLRWDLK